MARGVMNPLHPGSHPILGTMSLKAEVDVPVEVWTALLSEGHTWTFDRSKIREDGTYRINLSMVKLRPFDDSAIELTVENCLVSSTVFKRLLEGTQQPHRHRLAPMFEWLDNIKQGDNR